LPTRSRAACAIDGPWLRGKERETQQFQLDASGAPTYELGGSLHTYVSARTTPVEPGKTDPDDDAYDGTCAAPKSLISGKDQYYDGSDTAGGRVSKGDITKTASAVEASGPDQITKTVTTSATFDAYGRTNRRRTLDGVLRLRDLGRRPGERHRVPVPHAAVRRCGDDSAAHRRHEAGDTGPGRVSPSSADIIQKAIDIDEQFDI
jgi:hypothetical protein